MSITIELQTISEGYDRETCWVHPRPGAIANVGVVVTMHKLRITGDDVFYPINSMRSDDGGKTWSGPTEHGDAFARRQLEDGSEMGICDFWPGWHAASNSLLGIGHTILYVGDNIPDGQRPRSTAYSIYDQETEDWSPWQAMQSPFLEEGAGSVQRVDLPDGDILLPTYFVLPHVFKSDLKDRYKTQYGAAVMRCRFDGKTLSYIEHGNEMTVDDARGLAEPSLAVFDGRYFLTIRNDLHGYVTTSEDGLNYKPIQQWTFDDGSDLGSYDTQQHWVTMPDALYLVYTRRTEDNAHVKNHRAPLFIAQVDTEKLCVLRDTEKILVPNRGARLGNFGVVRISETESWVTTAEWMQTHPPEYWDTQKCEMYGSNNSVFVAKVRMQV